MVAKVTKYTWSKFCWDDWGNDGPLQDCGMAAQGLWINLLRLMFNSERQGYLQINGEPMTSLQIAKRTGFDKRTIEKQLAVLIEHKVCSVDEKGILYSRRMVREYEARCSQLNAHKQQTSDKVDANTLQSGYKDAASLQEGMAENSQKSQLPLYKNKSKNKSKNKEQDNIPPLIPPIGEEQTKQKSRAEKTNSLSGTTLPEDWVLSEKNREYALDQGIDPERTHEDFCDYWYAKAGPDAKKRNWNATWQRWCREAAKRIQNSSNYNWQPKEGNRARLRRKAQEMSKIVELETYKKKQNGYEPEDEFEKELMNFDPQWNPLIEEEKRRQKLKIGGV